MSLKNPHETTLPQGLFWHQLEQRAQDQRGWRGFLKGLCSQTETQKLKVKVRVTRLNVKI